MRIQNSTIFDSFYSHHICSYSTWNVKSVKKFSHRNQCQSWCWILDISGCWCFSWKWVKFNWLREEIRLLLIRIFVHKIPINLISKSDPKHLNQIVIRFFFHCCALCIHTTWVERDDTILDYIRLTEKRPQPNISISMYALLVRILFLTFYVWPSKLYHCKGSK